MEVREEINTLSGIYMCTNIDGIHVKEELIGYIDQHPFIVLSEFIDKYFVYGYGDASLYPAHLVGYDHFIYIKDEGYSYSYKNFIKHKVKDVSVFCEMYKDELKSASFMSYDQTYIDEYFNILKVCLDNGNTDLQYALDLKLDDYSNIVNSDIRYVLYESYNCIKYICGKSTTDEYKEEEKGESNNE